LFGVLPKVKNKHGTLGSYLVAVTKRNALSEPATVPQAKANDIHLRIMHKGMTEINQERSGTSICRDPQAQDI
jgi:hypothetical protein